jgi:hypothetical protein
MGQGPDGDIVDPGGRHLRDALKAHVARGFQSHAALSHAHRLAQSVRVHVVQQDHVGTAFIQHLGQLIQPVHLDLDPDHVRGACLNGLQHGTDAAACRDVIVLDQDRV